MVAPDSWPPYDAIFPDLDHPDIWPPNTDDDLLLVLLPENVEYRESVWRAAEAYWVCSTILKRVEGLLFIILLTPEHLFFAQWE